MTQIMRKMRECDALDRHSDEIGKYLTKFKSVSPQNQKFKVIISTLYKNDLYYAESEFVVEK